MSIHVHRRSGISMIEILVALTLLGIIGVSILRTFTSQARFADIQSKRTNARAVSRAPINVLMSEARMVEVGSGVVAASASSVTLRVPVAMGIVCGSAGGSTVVSLMPVDSVVLATAAISGHAWRRSTGAYAYTEGATTVAAGGVAGAAICTAASITTVAGGRTIVVTPPMHASAVPGTPAFIYQRVRFEFGASSVLPGRIGLWRTLEASGATEELAAPYDTATKFRFYRNSLDTSDDVVPPLTEIRGLEFSLVGASERSRYGRVKPETSRMQTAVFFMNRID
jgi:Tfp pilus assembly protein PilX